MRKLSNESVKEISALENEAAAAKYHRTNFSPSPPIQAPSYDTRKENLCEACKRVDKDYFLRSSPRLHLSWSVGLVKSNSQNCPFCKLLLSCFDVESDTSSTPDDDWTIQGHWTIFGKYELNSSKSQNARSLSSFSQVFSSVKTKFSRNADSSRLPLQESECQRVYKFAVSLTSSRTSPSKHESVLFRDSLQCILPQSTGLEIDRILKCRAINSGKVDFKLIREWIERCETGHTTCKRLIDKPQSMTSFNMRLIDIQQERLINAPNKVRYLALSYVWGPTKQLKLLSSNPEELRTKGSLSPKNPAMPKTIQDTMYVCRALGENYLWVDALCIMQDLELDKQAQIGVMDKIYHNAFLTIVAAVGDASTGLSGGPGGPSRTEAMTASVQGLKVCLAPNTLADALSLSPWSTRGWTLQEKLVSQRLLVFTDGMVFFECKQTTFREDVVLESDRGEVSLSMWQPVTRIIDSTDGLKVSEKNRERIGIGMQLEEFRDIVSQYCSRALSHEGDVLNAFAGVLNTFEPALGEFRFGMPLRFLSLMLLWKAEGRFEPTRRTGVDIPSWSWAAWKGYKFSLDSHGGLLQNASSPIMDFQMSTTDTYSHVGGSGLISDPISLARLHDSIKAHCATAVPPSFAGLQNRGLTPSLSRYLCFWTSAAAFSVDEKSVSPEEISSARDTFDYYVRGKDERVIGTITLSQKWRRAQSNKLELIVLAVLNGHLLHVMAIERVDGIAQRVQILNEPIEQGIWLRANPQRKFITLG
jgi:hypothetical protein